jgi:CPA2 family monovalent cation:H+ antiporter-2
MGLAPVLIQHNAAIGHVLAAALTRLQSTHDVAVTDENEQLENHIVLCGFGRIGRLVGIVLEAARLPYVAVESDLGRFREAREQGHDVIFGDASRRRVLEAARLDRARLLIVTLRRLSTVQRILHHARQRDPQLPALVSTPDDRDVPSLVAAGATTVFPENLAAGLGLADQALLLAGFTREDAAHVITSVRAQINPQLRDRVGV